MGRCGCSSSAASGAAIGTAPCITAAGAGTPASPFILSPRIDGAGGNLLSCGSGGLRVNDPDNPGNWVSYTPTWSSTAGAQPTIGNGVVSGIYRKRGRSLEVIAQVTFGSSTYGGGAGEWGFSLPAGLVCGFISTLALWGLDANAVAYVVGTGAVLATTSVIRPFTSAGPLGGNAMGNGSYYAMGGTVYTTT